MWQIKFADGLGTHLCLRLSPVVEVLETTVRIVLSFISLIILRLREPQAADYVIGSGLRLKPSVKI
jgi:hypothetical protein